MTTHVDACELARFRAWVAGRFGLHFQDAQVPWLQGVMAQRAGAMRGTPASYVDLLEAGAAAPELEALARELTVPETFFFRNMGQLRTLRDTVLPQRLLDAGAAAPLRILSAGCASGEEPYSIAMTLEARPPPACAGWSILGVDLNPEVIRKARRARYTAWSLRETPAEMKRRWFRAEGRLHAIEAPERLPVSFAVGNLCDAGADFWRAGPFDAVFCRNVLMYFAPDAARVVVERLRRCLVPGGSLFLGYAETLRDLSDAFELRQSGDAFYYRQRCTPAARQPLAPAHGAEPDDLVDGPRTPAAARDPEQPWFAVIAEAAARIRALTDGVSAPHATDDEAARPDAWEKAP